MKDTKIDTTESSKYSSSRVNISTSGLQEEKKLRCAIYGRVSTNFDSQKNSLENQRDLLINYAKQKGYTIVEFYEEHASGTKSKKRTELKRMLRDMENNKFDIILVKELSRLARNVRLAYDILDLSKYNGIKIEALDNSIGEGIDFEFMFTIYAALYQQEAQNTSNRVCASVLTRANRGIYVGSIPPYGYTLKDGKLYVRTDNTPDIVKFIFKEFLNGKGQDAIAGALNKRNLATPGQIVGRKDASEIWRGTTVKKILRNPHYTGHLAQIRTKGVSIRESKRVAVPVSEWVFVRDKHEAIISEEDFVLTQQLIEQKKRKCTNGKSNNHEFDKLLFCADCGRQMHYKKNGDCFVCGNYNKKSELTGKKMCTSHRVRQKELIAIIQDDLSKLARKINTTSYYDKLEAKLASKDSKLQKHIQKQQRLLENIQKKNGKMLSMLAEDLITIEEYRLYAQQADSEKKSIETELSKYDTTLTKKVDITVLKKLYEELKKAMTFEKLTTETLNRFIAKIEILQDGTPRVYYRFADFI